MGINEDQMLNLVEFSSDEEEEASEAGVSKETFWT